MKIKVCGMKDPQNIKLSGRGKTYRLPERYKGRRLGHNWSVNWVIDEWVKINQSKRQ